MATPPRGRLGDPTTGEGFECAVAYAIATKLGFTPDKVPGSSSRSRTRTRPAPRTSTIDINQVSYKPERAQAADLSDGYYFVNQSVVTLKDNPLA